MFQRPEPIAKLLKNYTRKGKFEQRHKHLAIWREWNDIVGPRMAERAFPLTVRRSVLLVRVVDSVWLNELSLHKPVIMENIHKAVGSKKIKDVRFLWGEEPGANPHCPEPDKSPLQKTTLPPPNPEEISVATEISSKLQDESMRETLRNLILHDLVVSRVQRGDD